MYTNIHYTHVVRLKAVQVHWSENCIEKFVFNTTTSCIMDVNVSLMLHLSDLLLFQYMYLSYIYFDEKLQSALR